MQDAPNKRKSWRFSWRVAVSALLGLAVVAGAVMYHLRRTIPPELLQDVRAGLAARKIADPDQRFAKYLEGRYGPQNDPTNRARVFLDFFNPEHIRAMQFLVKHSPPNLRQANIDATTRWVRNFRDSLSPQQQSDLSARLRAGGGDSLLAKATGEYNTEDVHYRGQTAPVISELLKTVATIKTQPAGP